MLPGFLLSRTVCWNVQNSSNFKCCQQPSSGNTNNLQTVSTFSVLVCKQMWCDANSFSLPSSCFLLLRNNRYQELGCVGLIDRLIQRRQHLIAFRICDYLNIKKDKILIHWASWKVRAAADSAGRDLHEAQQQQDILADIIVEKLNSVPGISYAEVASTGTWSNDCVWVWAFECECDVPNVTTHIYSLFLFLF